MVLAESHPFHDHCGSMPSLDAEKQNSIYGINSRVEIKNPASHEEAGYNQGERRFESSLSACADHRLPLQVEGTFFTIAFPMPKNFNQKKIFLSGLPEN